MNNDRLKRAVFSPWTLLFIAIFFRITLLGHESLWNDEVITIRDSLKPIAVIIGQRWDPHPPLYYLFLHYWLQINQSDAFTRLPSVIFGVISVMLIYLIGLRLIKQRAAWFLALLFALAPLHIWYSQETRMYSLVVMWALASTLFWILLLQNRYHSLWIWVGYIAFTSLGLYTHYTMILIIMGQNLYTVARWFARSQKRRDYPLKYWLLGQIMVVILYVPWISELPKHWGIIRASTNYPFWVLSTTPALLGMGLIGLLFFVALVIGLRQPDPLPDSIKRYVITAVLVATLSLFLIFLALAMTNRLTTFKRQTLVLFPFLYIFLLYLLPLTIKKWQYWATALLIISLIATTFCLLTLQKPNWRDAVALIHNQASSSDAIILNPPWISVTFDYYLQQSTQNNTPNRPHPEKIPLSQDYETTWLIANTKFEQWEDPDFKVRNWLTAHYEPNAPLHFGELEILRFNQPSQ